MGSPATPVGCPIRRYDAPLLGQASADWPGFRVIASRYDVTGRREFDWHLPELGLAVRLSGETHHEVRFEGGRTARFAVRPGQVLLLPADQRVRGHTRGVGTIREALLLLAPDWIARASGGEVALPRLGLRWSADLGNPLIREALLALGREVEQPSPLGRLAGESLARVILAELVRQHAGRPGPLARAAGSASRRLRRVPAFIDAHLTGDLSLLALAAEAGLGPAHFAQEFRRFVGLSPHQYVLKRRVERAAALLRLSDRSIAEVALEVGFSSQSHLTAAFRRVYGTPPGAFRAEYGLGWKSASRASGF